jgi:hypothetical protein
MESDPDAEAVGLFISVIMAVFILCVFIYQVVDKRTRNW